MKVVNVDIDTGKRVFCRKEVADICAVSVQTVRFWEEADLIPKSIRDDNDYRWWYEDDIEAIKLYASQNKGKRYK